MLLRSASDRVRILRGRDEVLEASRRLSNLCESCGQPGILDHLEYQFSLPGFRRKRPTLILIESATKHGVRPIAAVLLYEFLVLGLGTGVYASDFHGAARGVVAPRSLRPRAAFAAADALLRRGRLVQLSYEGAETLDHIAAVAGPRRLWAARRRQMSGYIPVGPSFEATLARLGKRTRRNLRYYRRLTETAFDAQLVDCPVLTKDEFLSFNRGCDYSASEKDARQRLRTLNKFPEPLYMGLRSNSGEWLSLLGGCRKGPDLLVEWQMNRSDLAEYSLSTTMRAYLIEYAAEHGCRRIYFVRGTTSSIANSMIPERIVDVVVTRPRTPDWLVQKVAGDRPDLPAYEGAIAILRRDGAKADVTQPIVQHFSVNA